MAEVAQAKGSPAGSGRRIASAGAHRNLRIHVWAPAFAGFGGGISAFSREFARALRACGHDVRLFGKFDRPGTFEEMPLTGAGTRSDFQSVRFASVCTGAVLRDRPEHIVSTHVNFAPVAHLAKRVSGIPCTIVAHGIDVHDGLGRAVTSALRSADRLLAVSEWTTGRLASLGGIDRARVKIFPNTFDDERFKVGPRPDNVAERYKIASGERVILTVARLSGAERYKGYDRIVRALPSIAKTSGPVRFLLVGEGNDRARIEGLARELGVDGRVTFAGFVPDEELADHYRLADVFAMPSTGEGFGIVFLESMGTGTPVVAGNRDGSPDALGSGDLGKLVDPEDVEAIADGIRSVLAREGPPLWYDRRALSEETVRRFGRAAYRERVRDLFS